MAEWTKEVPKEPGIYAVMISGDSEVVDGHVIYSYQDYQTFAVHNGFNEDGDPVIVCSHDEEPEWIIAWYGPIEIPAYKVPNGV